jgi:tetratricopeptide (TPR) repeat protein
MVDSALSCGARWLWLMGLGLFLGTAHANLPDSLSINDKAQINKLAEIQHKDYQGLLQSIADLSAESESDASEVQEMLTGASEGDMRMFFGPNALIQDDIDPDLKAGSMGLDRKVADYGNDLFLYFQAEGNSPVVMEVQAIAEPAIGPQNVYTKILYEVRFNGHHRKKPTPYAPHRRVMTLVAEPKGTKDWSVYIAADDYYDEAKGFVAFKLEKEMKEADAAGATLTAEMLAYQESARRAEEEATRAREERKKRFDDAIAAGTTLLTAGEFDDAEDMYKAAAKIDPLSIEPLVRIKATQKARLIKQQSDEKKFSELMDKGHVLRSMHEYGRALDSYQKAAAIYPKDLRCKPMIDSLDAMVKAKGDHERFIDAGDYQGSLGEAQQALKMPGMQDDADLHVLQARSLIGLNKRQDAINVLSDVIRRNPYHAEALRTRAEILRKSTNPEERAKAIPDLMVLKNRDVWDVTSYHHYAMLLCLDLKRCKEAVDVLQEALQREPGNARTLYLLGRVNSVDGFKEYGVALKDLSEAIQLDSACGCCWLERGIVLLELDSAKEAEHAIERAKSLGLDQQYAAWVNRSPLTCHPIRRALTW